MRVVKTLLKNWTESCSCSRVRLAQEFVKSCSWFACPLHCWIYWQDLRFLRVLRTWCFVVFVLRLLAFVSLLLNAFALWLRFRSFLRFCILWRTLRFLRALSFLIFVDEGSGV